MLGPAFESSKAKACLSRNRFRCDVATLQEQVAALLGAVSGHFAD